MTTSLQLRNLSIMLFLFTAASLSANAQSTFQASNAEDFNTGMPVAGAGTLLREDDGVELRFIMDGLDSKAIYTLWWIIFNNPEECIAGAPPALCGSGDLNPNRDGPGINPVDRGVRNAGALIASPSGIGNSTAEMDVGPAPEGAPGFGQLNDSVGAEIHIVIQTHGRALTGSVAQQMITPGAICNKKCENQFGIVFLPVAP